MLRSRCTANSFQKELPEQSTTDWITHFAPSAKGLAGLRLNAPRKAEVALLLDGERVEVPLDLAAADSFWDGGDDWWATEDSTYFERGAAFVMPPYRADSKGGASAADGAILAPMPGKVIAVDVAAGEAVTKGQRLLVLEAMKMEHALTAPFDGTVAELAVSEGQQVQVEVLLARVEKASE